jgi:hypothetical protein
MAEKRKDYYKKSPVDALESAIWKGSVFYGKRRFKAPGKIIEALPDMDRKSLRELKSEDIATHGH